MQTQIKKAGKTSYNGKIKERQFGNRNTDTVNENGIQIRSNICICIDVHGHVESPFCPKKILPESGKTIARRAAESCCFILVIVPQSTYLVNQNVGNNRQRLRMGSRWKVGVKRRDASSCAEKVSKHMRIRFVQIVTDGIVVSKIILMMPSVYCGSISHICFCLGIKWDKTIRRSRENYGC